MTYEVESFISRLSRTTFSALRDVWLIWIALAVLTSLPYAVAALRTPPQHLFTEVLTAYDDTFTYFAWMRQSADGHLLMCDLFTSEQQSCQFFLPLWTALGVIARMTGLPMNLTFHLARLFAGLLLLLGARAVASSVLESQSAVRFSLWLYAMSGGLGWLVYILKSRVDLFDASPGSGAVDLNMPEAIAFRSVFAQVHFAIGAALIFASINLLFSALVDQKPRRAILSGVMATMLAVVHPYLIVVVFAVAGVALCAWPWLNDGRSANRSDYRVVALAACAFAATALPGFGYLVYLSGSNAVLREWLRITDTLSPSPWEYVLGFGFVGVLSVVGFRLIWAARVPQGRLLVIWAVVQAALLYAPLSFQRRLVEGLQLPLSIAASVALFWISDRVFKGASEARFRSLFLTGVITFASLTNIGFVIGQIVARSNSSTDSRRYLPADLVAAFGWLRTNSDRDAVLFSSYLTGNVAPSMTGLRVFLGHYGQTIHSDDKGAQVTAFYASALSDEATSELFREHGMRYVIYGPFERAISDSFTPPGWLKLAYRAGAVEVFEVIQDAGSGQL